MKKQKKSLILSIDNRLDEILVLPKETILFIDSISKGLSDSEKGKVYATAQLKNRLKKRRTV
ncbi:MAG: hypothetical protein GY936_13990 [Ignavibacteriae bacterium]|nr:hypothetical protein [Ignavibacteriota bacterium]